MKDLIRFLDKYDVDYNIDGESVVCGGIDLSGNGISDLPSSIGNLECESLNLKNNNISKLPDSIVNIKCNILYLNDNMIRELPENIGDLKCNILHLRDNNIRELPDSIGDLKCKYLNLNNNDIPKGGIKYLDKIKGLIYALTDYSEDLDEVKRICVINSRQDKIKSIIG